MSFCISRSDGKIADKYGCVEGSAAITVQNNQKNSDKNAQQNNYSTQRLFDIRGRGKPKE